MGKDVVVGDFEIINDVFTCSDVIAGIGVAKKGSLSAQDNRKNNDEYDFSDGR